MGEIIEFPIRDEDRDPRDIADTPEGQQIIREIARPAFNLAFQEAKDALPDDAPDFDIDLGGGDWSVIPLGE